MEPVTTSDAMLSLLMAGAKPDEAALTAFIRRVWQEDAMLDYKDARFLDEKDAPFEIRTTVASFANVSGGVLFIGIAEAPKDPVTRKKVGDRTISVASSKSGDDLMNWLTNVMKEDFARYDVPPRIDVIPCANGVDVAYIAVARNDDYVRPKGRLFLRVGESSLEAKGDLEVDLLLGRRRQPTFRVLHIGCRGRIEEVEKANVLKMEVSVSVENTSLVWCEHVRIGIVSWDFARTGRGVVPESVLAHVDHVDPESRRLGNASLYHQATPTRPANAPMAPFDRRHTEHALTLWMPLLAVPMRWRAALYVASKDARVRWYQVDETYTLKNASTMDRPDGWVVTATPVLQGRPVVAFAAP
jgi:hypothetical protein